jgi:hypothetical protein
MPGPQAVVGGDVEDQAATGHRAIERGGVAQIAGDAFHIQFRDATAGAHQGANGVAALTKKAGDVPTEEPGSSRDQNRS